LQKEILDFFKVNEGGTIVKKSEQLAATVVARYPNAWDFPFRYWSYSQGYMLWGFIHLYERTGEQKYLDYVLRFAGEFVPDTGTLRGFTSESLDDMMCGSILAWAYHKTGEERYAAACGRILASFDDYPRNPDGAFWHGRELFSQLWIDGIFMCGMFLLHHGRYVGDSDRCFAEVLRQLELGYQNCRKGSTGLLYHGRAVGDEKPTWADPETGLSSEVWSEGLGWYALMLAEAADHLPAGDGKTLLLSRFRALCEDLIGTQGANGLWYQVVDRGSEPGNFQDASGSAMFAYALSRANALGVLPGDRILPALERAKTGLPLKIRETDGQLPDIFDACDGLCVQDNYEAYVNYTRTLNAKEAVGGMLWALTELGL